MNEIETGKLPSSRRIKQLYESGESIQINIDTNIERIQDRFFFHELVRESERARHFIIEDMEADPQTLEDPDTPLFLYLKQQKYKIYSEYLHAKKYYTQLRDYCKASFTRKDVIFLHYVLDYEDRHNGVYELITIFDYGESDRIDLDSISDSHINKFLKNVCIMLEDMKKFNGLYNGNLHLKNIVLSCGQLKLAGFKPIYLPAHQTVSSWRVDLAKRYGEHRLDLYLMGILWLCLLKVNFGDKLKSVRPLEFVVEDVLKKTSSMDKTPKIKIITKLVNLNDHSDLQLDEIVLDFDEYYIMENIKIEESAVNDEQEMNESETGNELPSLKKVDKNNLFNKPLEESEQFISHSKVTDIQTAKMFHSNVKDIKGDGMNLTLKESGTSSEHQIYSGPMLATAQGLIMDMKKEKRDPASRNTLDPIFLKRNSERGSSRSRSTRRKARSVHSHDMLNSLTHLSIKDEVQSDNHILKDYSSANKGSKRSRGSKRKELLNKFKEKVGSKNDEFIRNFVKKSKPNNTASQDQLTELPKEILKKSKIEEKRRFSFGGNALIKSKAESNDLPIKPVDPSSPRKRSTNKTISSIHFAIQELSAEDSLISGNKEREVGTVPLKKLKIEKPATDQVKKHTENSKTRRKKSLIVKPNKVITKTQPKAQRSVSIKKKAVKRDKSNNKTLPVKSSTKNGLNTLAKTNLKQKPTLIKQRSVSRKKEQKSAEQKTKRKDMKKNGETLKTNSTNRLKEEKTTNQSRNLGKSKEIKRTWTKPNINTKKLAPPKKTRTALSSNKRFANLIDTKDSKSFSRRDSAILSNNNTLTKVDTLMKKNIKNTSFKKRESLFTYNNTMKNKNISYRKTLEESGLFKKKDKATNSNGDSIKNRTAYDDLPGYETYQKRIEEEEKQVKSKLTIKKPKMRTQTSYTKMRLKTKKNTRDKSIERNTDEDKEKLKKTIDNSIKEAKQQEIDKNYGKAVGLLKSHLKAATHSQTIEILRIIGNCYYQKKQYKDSIKSIKDCVELIKSDKTEAENHQLLSPLLFLLAKVYKANKEWANAREILINPIFKENEGNPPQYHLICGIVNQELNFTSDAYEAFKKHLQAITKTNINQLSITILMSFFKKLFACLARLNDEKQLKETFSASFDFVNSYTKVKMNLKEKEEGIEDFRGQFLMSVIRTLILNKNNDFARHVLNDIMNKSLINYSKKTDTERLKFFELYVEYTSQLNPQKMAKSDKKTYIDFANEGLKILEECEDSETKHKNQLFIHYNLGLYYLQEKKYKKAKKHFEMSLELCDKTEDNSKGETFNILFYIASCLYQLEKFEDCPYYFEKIRELGCTDKDIVLRSIKMLSKCYYRLGAFEKLKRTLKMWISINLKKTEKDASNFDLYLFLYYIACDELNSTDFEGILVNMRNNLTMSSPISEITHYNILFNFTNLSARNKDVKQNDQIYKKIKKILKSELDKKSINAFIDLIDQIHGRYVLNESQEMPALKRRVTVLLNDKNLTNEENVTEMVRFCINLLFMFLNKTPFSQSVKQEEKFRNRVLDSLKLLRDSTVFSNALLALIKENGSKIRNKPEIQILDMKPDTVALKKSEKKIAAITRPKMNEKQSFRTIQRKRSNVSKSRDKSVHKNKSKPQPYTNLTVKRPPVRKTSKKSIQKAFN